MDQQQRLQRITEILSRGVLRLVEAQHQNEDQKVPADYLTPLQSDSGNPSVEIGPVGRTEFAGMTIALASKDTEEDSAAASIWRKGANR